MLGLCLGLVPLVVSALALYGAFARLGLRPGFANVDVFIGAGVAYVAALVAGVVCLRRVRARYVGYGLMAAVLASPVIAAIACEVLLFTTFP